MVKLGSECRAAVFTEFYHYLTTGGDHLSVLRMGLGRGDKVVGGWVVWLSRVILAFGRQKKGDP